MKRHPDGARVLLLLAAALLLAAMPACKPEDGAGAQDTPARPPERVVQVEVRTVTPTPLEDILVLPGETDAESDVRIPADTDGVVEWVGVDEGGTVSEGELLARVDVKSLKSVLDRAQANYELTDSICRRRGQLFERELVTPEEMDKVKTECELAESQLKQARIEFERGFVRAPVGGIVNKVYVDPGEFVRRGEPVADVVNVDRIVVKVNVPELDVRFLEKGEPARVTVDALPEKVFQGVVDFVSYKADAATKTFLVEVVIENPGHAVRPGMIARAAFVRRIIPDALVAPLFALVDKGGERLLFVEEDGVAHARTVKIGVIHEDVVQVTSGLEPGDRLIVVGQTEVEEGMKVTVQ